MPSTLVKRIRQRFGITAPKMTVRTHVAWYWRWLGLAVLAAVSLALAAWIYDAGRRFAGFDSSEVQGELSSLRSTVARLQKESAGLREVANASDARLKIDQSAQAQLAAQMKQLGDENTRLKEDLALFQQLNPGGKREQPLSIQRFTLDRGALPGEFQYHMLVVQGGQSNKDFQGPLQLYADLQAGNRNNMIPITDEGSPPGTVRRLSFRFFQRQEGSFQLPADAQVRGVQARVFETGGSQPMAVESVKLP